MRTLPATNTTGYYFDIQNVEVNTDDTIDFLIDRRGNYSSDVTWFYPTITFEDADTIFDLASYSGSTAFSQSVSFNGLLQCASGENCVYTTAHPPDYYVVQLLSTRPDGNTQ